jgi:hypothetical protein
MIFDKSKVYTALNAEELDVGSEVILADYLESLKQQVEANSWPTYVRRLDLVMGTSSVNRFRSGKVSYNLAYLVRKPEEDLYVAYVDHYGEPHLDFGPYAQWDKIQEYKGAKHKLFIGTKQQCEEWCDSRDKFADVILAWEDGKQIQIRLNNNGWCDCVVSPEWGCDCEYRVKPDGLVWTDLKMGNILWRAGDKPAPLGGKHEYVYVEERRMVTGIVDDPGTKRHVQLGGDWIDDNSLKEWRKAK